MSVQGEGIHIGEPQVFVRLFGCNLKCKWCDTKYAIEKTTGNRENGYAVYKNMTPHEVYMEIAKYKCRRVCITGGEPLTQKNELIKLIKKLENAVYFIQICTNGTIWNDYVFNAVDCVSMDMKPPSSGMKSNQAFLKRLRYLCADVEVKVIVNDKKDLKFALEQIAPKLRKVPLILQPVGGKENSLRDLVAEVLKSNNLHNIRTLPQLHKLIWGLARKK